MMEALVGRENMLTSLQRVVSNRRTAGVYRMTVEELKPYLRGGVEPNQRRAVVRPIPAVGSAEGRNTEGGRKRGPKAWHPAGTRSADTTGAARGTEPEL
jgi:hypothetical protein